MTLHQLAVLLAGTGFVIALLLGMAFWDHWRQHVERQQRDRVALLEKAREKAREQMRADQAARLAARSGR